MIPKSKMTRANQLSLIKKARRLNIARECVLLGFEHAVKLDGTLFMSFSEASQFLNGKDINSVYINQKFA